MKTTYRNPWFGKVKGAYGKVIEMPEFYESDAVPIQHAGCLIYARQEYGYHIFDVVVNGACVAQRAGLNGAKCAAEEMGNEEHMKPMMPKITEPDEDKIHYAGPIGLDQVTLCGLTDFIGATVGEDTDEPINCWHCQMIVDFVRNHRTKKSDNLK